MIPAAEALRLPRAQLTGEQKAAADKLEAAISAHVEAHMERRGCYDFKTAERDPNVIADINQRLKAAGWLAQWKPWLGAAMFSRVGGREPQEHIGWHLELMPTDEAYQAALGRAALQGDSLVA